MRQISNLHEIEQKLLLQHSKNYNLVSRCLIQSIVQCEKVHKGEKESSGREEMPADQFHRQIFMTALLLGGGGQKTYYYYYRVCHGFRLRKWLFLSRF